MKILSASTDRDTLIHSFKYLLSTYVLSTFLGPGDTMKKSSHSCFKGVYGLVEEIQ